MHAHDCTVRGCYDRATNTYRTDGPTYVTHWMELTFLDDTAATFTHPQGDQQLRMPVDTWHTLGRPGHIETRTHARVPA